MKESTTIAFGSRTRASTSSRVTLPSVIWRSLTSTTRSSCPSPNLLPLLPRLQSTPLPPLSAYSKLLSLILLNNLLSSTFQLSPVATQASSRTSPNRTSSRVLDFATGPILPLRNRRSRFSHASPLWQMMRNPRMEPGRRYRPSLVFLFPKSLALTTKQWLHLFAPSGKTP